MVKKIVLAAAVFVLAGVMIAANIVLAVNSTVIHSWFDKSTSSYDNNEQQAVITQGDELVRDIAEQSMVLLRNETTPFLSTRKRRVRSTCSAGAARTPDSFS